MLVKLKSWKKGYIYFMTRFSGDKSLTWHLQISPKCKNMLRV
jgi:hypothetical protein